MLYHLGTAGVDGLSRDTGYVLVRHSQQTRVPGCPLGLTKLWDGYSFLYMQGNEGSHSQSLGMSVMILTVFSEIHRFRGRIFMGETLSFW